MMLLRRLGGPGVFEEIVPAIASALSAQGSALIAAGSKSALKSVCDAVRARFGRGTPEEGSLDAALRHPGDPASVAALAEALARVMADDPAFARETVAAWQAVTATGPVGDDAVVNNFSGQATTVVQARSIRGGIRF
jgi:hypothetical protein